jgi:hypothetical protein
MRLDELHDKAIDYIVAHMDEHYLTDWEKGFFSSVMQQWKMERFLTENQRLKLGEIWDRQP